MIAPNQAKKPKKMAENPEIQAELKVINEEFSAS